MLGLARAGPSDIALEGFLLVFCQKDLIRSLGRRPDLWELGGGRECGVTHQYYVLQFTRAGIFTRHWTAAPDKQMRLARTHTDHAAASAAAPQDWRSPSRAHVNPAAAKCKPRALHSAMQESADFRRARKLG